MSCGPHCHPCLGQALSVWTCCSPPSAAGTPAQLAPSRAEESKQLGKHRPKPLRSGSAQKPKITRLAPPWQQRLLKKGTCDSQQSSQPSGSGPTLSATPPLPSLFPPNSGDGPAQPSTFGTKPLNRKRVMAVALARFSLEGSSAGPKTSGSWEHTLHQAHA